MEAKNNGFKDIGEFLRARFRPYEADLKQRYLALPAEQIKVLIASILISFAHCVQSELKGMRKVIKAQLKAAEQAKSSAKAHLEELRSILESSRHAYGKYGSFYYYAMYFLLISSLIVVFSSSFHLILPEIHFLVGVGQSIVIAAPSYLVYCMFIKSVNRDRFLRSLHRTGITAAIVMSVSIAVARLAAYHLMQSMASTGSFLYGTSSSASWIETLKLVSSSIAFVSMVGTEICFGSRLMISIDKFRSKLRDSTDLNAQIIESDLRVRELEEDCLNLSRQLAQIRDSKDIIANFIESKRMTMTADVSIARLDFRRKEISRLRQCTTDELLQLTEHEEDYDDETDEETDDETDDEK